MSRSNYDKPFYVDVGTSVVAVRCASNHDVVLEYDHARMPYAIELAKKACDRMNKEAEIGRPRRNCDVGTAEEQQARHCAWCRKHGIYGDKKAGCAHSDMSCVLCALRWSQMPYVEQEGGAK